MYAKNKTAILVGGILALIIMIVALLTTSPSYAGTGSPFLGDWYGTDADGSNIRMIIAGNPAGPFQITSTDSYISFCNGEAGILKGTASLNPVNSVVLEANMEVVCFTTGDTVEIIDSFVYDPATDTLSGMSVTWYRADAHAPACIIPAMGLTGWWPGDGNAEDIVAQAGIQRVEELVEPVIHLLSILVVEVVGVLEGVGALQGEIVPLD